MHAGITTHTTTLRRKDRMLRLTKRQACVVFEGQARRGRRYAGTRPRQQPRAHFALQLRQLLAQCRSADPEFERRSAKAAVLQNTQEIPKLT